MGISERRRLVYTAIAISVVGLVTGFILGNVLLASPTTIPGQYNERTTTAETVTTIAHTHDGSTHTHTIKSVITVTEGTPHFTFHAQTAPLPSAGSAPSAPSPAKPLTYEVMQVSETFKPHVLTVPVGSTVTWTSYDTDQIVHDQHTAYVEGLFDSGSIPYLGSFSYTFTEPGVYDVYCYPHETMHMQITVE